MPAIGRRVLGRAKVTENLHARLLARRAVAVATGQGGIGKTTLARHYVETHGKHYRGVLWVRAEEATTLVADLGLLAAVVKVDGCEQMAPEQKARALLSALDGLEQDWLIVFDNAPDDKALKAWMPGGARVRVLVTSRSTHWPPAFARLAPDLLPTGKRSDAGPVLLMQEACRHDDPDGALELARELGGLPLALVAAGGLIREQGGSFDAYREKLATVLAAVPAGDYPDSVIGAVKLSYDALDDDARAVLDLFAWYAPEGLEARLLTDVPKCSAPNPQEFWDDVPADVWALSGDTDRAEAALAALVRRSLLVRASEGYGLHRMSAAAVCALQEMAGRRDAAARAAAAVLAASYPFDSDFTESWPASARLTPHVLALHRVWPMGEGELLTSAAAGYLFNQTSIYLRHMAEPAPALALAVASLKLTQARLPESDRDVAAGWSILGAAYRAAGKPTEAVAAQAENVRLCKLHRHGAADLATAHNNHAAALRELGLETDDRALLEQALAADEAALALRREALGAESEAVASSLANLAVSHQALGDPAQARALSLQALAILRKRLPQGDARLGTTLTNAGSSHLMLGKAGAALPLLTEALVLLRAAFERDNHPHVKKTASWLVACLLVLARRDPARVQEAQRIAAEFGLDWEREQRLAAQYPGPVDPPAPPPQTGGA